MIIEKRLDNIEKKIDNIQKYLNLMSRTLNFSLVIESNKSKTITGQSAKIEFDTFEKDTKESK